MDLSSVTANQVLNALADVTLKLDTDGLVLEAQVNRVDATDLRQIQWQGKALNALVSASQRDRVANVIDWCVAHPNATTTVTLSHPNLSSDTTATLRYVFFYSADEQRLIAVGEDKGELSSAKQQLVNSQLAMERDYWSLRQTETRYRRLLDMSSDGFIIVDDSSQRIVECNQAAGPLLQIVDQSIVGLAFPSHIDDASKHQLSKMIDDARIKGSASAALSTLANGHALFVAIDHLSQTTGAILLVRLSQAANATLPATEQHYFERVPDALLQLDHSGRITAANGVFLQWIQEPSDRHVLGRNADDWLGRTGVDLQVLLDNLSQRSVVTRFASTLRTQAQGFTDIEISGSSRSHSSDNEYLLFLRDTSRRIHHRETTVEALPSSIEEITSRVGQTPLKDLVRESTDVIEALCIESALKLTRNNRASAAELLGLSRQSLYTKLRRFGIGETEIEAETG